MRTSNPYVQLCCAALGRGTSMYSSIKREFAERIKAQYRQAQRSVEVIIPDGTGKQPELQEPAFWR